jgi:tetratricopeptide (TPR) repeat protein/transglutaminase-like putative cysteine protease
MIKPCFSSLLLITLTTVLLAQSQSADKAAKPKSDYSQEAFVVEHTSCKIKFANDGTFTQENIARIRVQSDAGVQQYGLLTFSYPSATETLDIDYIRVRKLDGTVVTTPAENIQEMPADVTRSAPFYSDLHERHVAVKGLGIGDVLEYSTHENVTKPLVPGQFWFQYNFSHDIISLQDLLEVRVPRERQIAIKSPEVKPSVSDADQYRIYTWSSSNLQRKDKNEKQEQAKTAWEIARGRLPQPDVLISSFQSWEEIGLWYGELQREKIKPTAELRAKAAELTKDAADDDAKLRAIYDYVSTQFRYIGVAFGIGRYQPHSAKDVFDNQYGDCKDKHTLLASLLSAVGIQAYPALISSAHEIDADIPSPAQIDHVITAVPRGEGIVWLDTTSEVGPFQYLISPLRDKHALVIWDDKPASLVQTPSSLPIPATQTFRMEATLNDAGMLEGSAEFAARGDLEYILRSAFRGVPLPQWKELVQRISFGLGFGGEVSEVTASSPEKTQQPFHFTYKYTRKEYADWPNRRILAPSPVISLPSPPDEPLSSSVPIFLGPPADIVFNSRLHIPNGYRPELPAAIHLKRDFAEYDATYLFKDGVLIAERHLRTMTPEVSNKAYEEYKSFYKTVQDDYGSYIPLSSDSAKVQLGPAPRASSIQVSTSSLPDSPNEEALRLEREAKDAVSRRDMQGAISSLYRALGTDPKFTRAWIMLGSLLMTSKQKDAAQDAFQKAITIDPKLPLPHKMFGYTLMAAAKFEEAVPIWQEYIQLVPDDADGPANLASALGALKRYDEAAVALESAIKLSPEQMNLQSELALAYIRAGKGEKAEPALQKIAKLNPSPEMLNNIAYEMAEADQQIPLAVSYAEKAVRAEEETSNNIELSKLTLNDVRHTVRLAAFWDTLGWAQNRLSNFDEAENNLNAAWRLSRDGVPAAHLCHVYERQHKTQAAVHMCRLAMQRLPLASGPAMYESSVLMKETISRLDRLAPGPAKAADTSIDEINRMRTFKLPRVTTGTATADFFVLLATDPQTKAFKVLDVKFISGSQKLRSAGSALKTLNFNLHSPDASPTRVVLRGTLGCYPYSGCDIVLLDPNSVKSLD